MSFRERVTPPPTVVILACVLAASFGLILVPVSAGLAGAAGLTLAVLAGLTVIVTSPVVSVENSRLRAGNAQIEGEFLGEVTVLDRAGVRRVMGPDADARAYACHRDHAPGGVVVEIVDPRDPAPYWLISSGDAESLAEAIRAIARADSVA